MEFYFSKEYGSSPWNLVFSRWASGRGDPEGDLCSWGGFCGSAMAWGRSLRRPRGPWAGRGRADRAGSESLYSQGFDWAGPAANLAKRTPGREDTGLIGGAVDEKHFAQVKGWRPKGVPTCRILKDLKI